MSSPVPPHPDSGFVGGFFAGLVDFRFTKFIGPRVLSVIYTLAFALVVIASLFFFFALLSEGGLSALAAIIVVPIVTLLYLTLIRLSLELYSAILRTAENTARAAQLLEAQLTGAGYQPPPSPYGGQPPYGPGPAPGAGPGPGSDPSQAPGGYGPPQGNYGPPQGNHGPAQGNYGQPQGEFGPPPGGYGPPPGGYGPAPGAQYPYGAG